MPTATKDGIILTGYTIKNKKLFGPSGKELTVDSNGYVTVMIEGKRRRIKRDAIINKREVRKATPGKQLVQSVDKRSVDTSISSDATEQLKRLNVLNYDLLISFKEGSFYEFINKYWHLVSGAIEIDKSVAVVAFLVENNLDAVVLTDNVDSTEAALKLAAMYKSFTNETVCTYGVPAIQVSVKDIKNTLATISKLEGKPVLNQPRGFMVTPTGEEGYELRARSTKFDNLYVTGITETSHPATLIHGGNIKYVNRIYAGTVSKVQEYFLGGVTTTYTLASLLDLSDKAIKRLREMDSVIKVAIGEYEPDVVQDISESKEVEEAPFTSNLNWFTDHEDKVALATLIYNELPTYIAEENHPIIVKQMREDGLPPTLQNAGTYKAYTMRHILERLVEGPDIRCETYKTAEENCFAMFGTTSEVQINAVMHTSDEFRVNYIELLHLLMAQYPGYGAFVSSVPTVESLHELKTRLRLVETRLTEGRY